MINIKSITHAQNQLRRNRFYINHEYYFNHNWYNKYFLRDENPNILNFDSNTISPMCNIL